VGGGRKEEEGGRREEEGRSLHSGEGDSVEGLPIPCYLYCID
jgi:hypothetical protein